MIRKKTPRRAILYHIVYKKEESPRSIAHAKAFRRFEAVRSERPKDLLSEGLDPQREHAEVVVPKAAPAPGVAAEAELAEVAEVEPVADMEQGVGARPVAPERHALARRPEMGQDEAGEKGGRAEAREVLRRELHPRAELGEECHLLGRGLVRTLGHETRNPEHQRIRGWRIFDAPVLEVLELLVAGAGLRRMGLQSEARADAPADRNVRPDPVPDGETAVRREHGLEPRRDLRFRDGLGQERLNDSGGGSVPSLLHQFLNDPLKTRLELATPRDDMLSVCLLELEAIEPVFQKPTDLLLLSGRDPCGHRLSPSDMWRTFARHYAGLGFTTLAGNHFPGLLSGLVEGNNQGQKKAEIRV